MIGSNELSHWSHSHVYVQVHLLIDQMNAAIVDFNKAVTLQPNFPVAYVQKLYTDYRQFLLHNYKSSFHLEIVIIINPINVGPQTQLGTL